MSTSLWRATTTKPISILMLAGSLVAACGDDDGSGGTGGTPSSGGGANGGAAPQGGGGAADGGEASAGGAEPTGGAGGATGGSGEGGSGGNAAGTTISTSACAGDVCDFTIEGFDLAEHDGKTVYFGILRQGQMGFVAEGSGVVENGTFSGALPGSLEKGALYFVNYYLDLSSDGECEPTPTDSVWRISLPVINAHYHLSMTDDATYLSNLGCGGFP
ncbi:MAG: hypothetical protein HOW73_20085 [Polyangiaceae bacterium]|nr:hypothetical protein [Polyangiaceae bacterium]